MNEKARNAKPIARKQGLVIQELPDEVLVYDLDRDRAHCLNQTAAFIWQRCNGRNTSAQIARTLGQHFDSAVDEKVIWLALDQLGRNHLLDPESIPAPSVLGMNRRTMVRTLGLAAAVALPLVTSIIAPTPAQANTCVPQGSACINGGVPCCGTFNCVAGTCQ